VSRSSAEPTVSRASHLTRPSRPSAAST
jgi:hypothetical protein